MGEDGGHSSGGGQLGEGGGFVVADFRQQFADGGVQDIHAAVDGVREGGFFPEIAHQSGGVGVDDAVGAGHWHGEDGGEVVGVGAAAGLVVGQQFGEAGVGYDVAVGGDDRGVARGQQGHTLPQCAAAPQGNALATVMGADAVGAAIAEVVFDHIGQVADEEHDFGNAGGAQPVQLARQDGLPAQRNHRFGDSVGKGTQALPLAAGQN